MKKRLQYTVRAIPRELDRRLRERAKKEKKSLNLVLLEALTRGLGNPGEPARHHDLDHLAGTWVEDPEFDEAIRDQDRVDESDWQ
jgi:hypothetical protein